MYNHRRNILHLYYILLIEIKEIINLSYIKLFILIFFYIFIIKFKFELNKLNNLHYKNLYNFVVLNGS